MTGALSYRPLPGKDVNDRKGRHMRSPFLSTAYALARSMPISIRLYHSIIELTVHSCTFIYFCSNGNTKFIIVSIANVVKAAAESSQYL
jgi:hypothetical protein